MVSMPEGRPRGQAAALSLLRVRVLVNTRRFQWGRVAERVPTLWRARGIGSTTGGVGDADFTAVEIFAGGPSAIWRWIHILRCPWRKVHGRVRQHAGVPPSAPSARPEVRYGTVTVFQGVIGQVGWRHPTRVHTGWSYRGLVAGRRGAARARIDRFRDRGRTGVGLCRRRCPLRRVGDGGGRPSKCLEDRGVDDRAGGHRRPDRDSGRRILGQRARHRGCKKI